MHSAQFLFLFCADAARVRLEHDADDCPACTGCRVSQHGGGLGISYPHTAVFIAFAQTTVAPSPVGIEVVAYLKLICLEKLHLFGGDVLLAAIGPVVSPRCLHLKPVGLHRDGVAVAGAGVKLAFGLSLRGVGEGLPAEPYPDERLARHVLRHHNGLELLRRGVVVGRYLAVRLVGRPDHSDAEIGLVVTENLDRSARQFFLGDSVAGRERELDFRHPVPELKDNVLIVASNSCRPHEIKICISAALVRDVKSRIDDVRIPCRDACLIGVLPPDCVCRIDRLCAAARLNHEFPGGEQPVHAHAYFLTSRPCVLASGTCQRLRHFRS